MYVGCVGTKLYECTSKLFRGCVRCAYDRQHIYLFDIFIVTYMYTPLCTNICTQGSR